MEYSLLSGVTFVSIGIKPIYDTCRVQLSGISDILKLPSISVTAFFLTSSFTFTVAPITGWPFRSVTVPDIALWAIIRPVV